jgi:hypothetical protein
MTRHFSSSLSPVLFLAGSHLRAANKPHAKEIPRKALRVKFRISDQLIRDQ